MQHETPSAKIVSATMYKHHTQTRPSRHALAAILVICFCAVCHGQTTLKAVYGWGNAARLGRWTCLLVTVDVANSPPMPATLEVAGTYGTGAALTIRQEMIVESRPRVYELLFPLNADPTRLAVTLRRQSDGKMLATQLLLDPTVFSPAGHVPITLLAADAGLIGLGGNVSDASLLQAQLAQAGLTAGIFNEAKLPAVSVGYEGISVLLLCAADLRQIGGDQERAIVDWVAAGGNLVLIPSADPLPEQLPFDAILPCDIGENQIVKLPSISLNGRQLQPRAGATAMTMPDGWTAYARRWKLGRVVVLPVDVAEMNFPNRDRAIEFWRTIFAGMVDVPGNRTITEVPVSDAQEDIMPVGPKMRDAIGRGPRETMAARNLLDVVVASADSEPVDWRAALPWMIGLGALLGPLDWFLSLRLGVSPRHWLTVVGWFGLVGGVAGYCFAKAQTPQREIDSLRLVDQADGKIVAMTDLLSFRSQRDENWRLLLDPAEWWEPANQAAANFSVNRFLQFDSRQDQEGCRPSDLKLRGGEPQSLRGQTMASAPPMIGINLRVEHNPTRVVGTLSNLGAARIVDLQVATAWGNARLAAGLNPGDSVNVELPLSDQEIRLDGLPEDALDLTPDRTDRIADLVKSGQLVCVLGEMPTAAEAQVADIAAAHQDWLVIRAVGTIAK